MTKAQRRAMYLEAARAVLEKGREGVFMALGDSDFDEIELDAVCANDGNVMLHKLPADLRAMLLILAATI